MSFKFFFMYARHDVYKNQFRAMFVMNVRVVRDEVLRYERKNKSKKRRKKEGPGKLVPYVTDGERNVPHVTCSGEQSRDGFTASTDGGLKDATTEGLPKMRVTSGDLKAAKKGVEKGVSSADIVQSGHRLDNGGVEELYHPVKCQECETEIAVFDKDEVYHFFNVLESIS